jgi:hypothetical protein
MLGEAGKGLQLYRNFYLSACSVLVSIPWCWKQLGSACPSSRGLFGNAPHVAGAGCTATFLPVWEM